MEAKAIIERDGPLVGCGDMGTDPGSVRSWITLGDVIYQETGKAAIAVAWGDAKGEELDAVRVDCRRDKGDYLGWVGGVARDKACSLWEHEQLEKESDWVFDWQKGGLEDVEIMRGGEGRRLTWRALSAGRSVCRRGRTRNMGGLPLTGG